MKIAFFEIQPWEKYMLKKFLKGHSIKFFEESLTFQHIPQIKQIEILSVFVNSKVDKSIISKLPKLKLIVTRSTGFDHIDIKTAKKRRIHVCNMPNYGENTVAEHTFALILAISRKIHKAHLRKLKGDFSLEGLKGFDLAGKTLGVIGSGKIGKHVIRIARGFEMKVLAYDHHPDTALTKELNFKYASIKEVLRKSNIVTVHVPYFKANHHLMGRKAFNTMKKGSILINTSRGEIVDTEALIEALDKKKIAGAGLDVIEGEKLIREEHELLYDHANHKMLQQLAENHVLLSKDNVVYTPHIAFYSQEALVRIIKNTIKVIKDYSGKKDLGKSNVC